MITFPHPRSWSITWARANELRAERYRDAGHTLEEYQQVVTVGTLTFGREQGWTEDEIAHEIARHMDIGRKMWDVTTTLNTE